MRVWHLQSFAFQQLECCCLRKNTGDYDKTQKKYVWCKNVWAVKESMAQSCLYAASTKAVLPNGSRIVFDIARGQVALPDWTNTERICLRSPKTGIDGIYKDTSRYISAAEFPDYDFICRSRNTLRQKIMHWSLWQVRIYIRSRYITLSLGKISTVPSPLWKSQKYISWTKWC